MSSPIVMTEEYVSANYNLGLLIAKTYELINAQPPKLTPINRTSKTLSGEPAYTLGDIIFATQAAKYHSSFMNHGWAGWGYFLAEKYGEEKVEMNEQLGWSNLLQGRRTITPIDTQLRFGIHTFVNLGATTVSNVEFLLREAANLIRKNGLDIAVLRNAQNFSHFVNIGTGKVTCQKSITTWHDSGKGELLILPGVYIHHGKG